MYSFWIYLFTIMPLRFLSSVGKIVDIEVKVLRTDSCGSKLYLLDNGIMPPRSISLYMSWTRSYAIDYVVEYRLCCRILGTLRLLLRMRGVFLFLHSCCCRTQLVVLFVAQDWSFLLPPISCQVLCLSIGPTRKSNFF